RPLPPISSRSPRRLRRLVEDWRAELRQPEQAERALTVVVEDAQVVGLVQIAQDHVEMPAVALFGGRERHFVRDELFNALGGELREQRRLGDRLVRREHDQRTAPGKQHERLHPRALPHVPAASNRHTGPRNKGTGRSLATALAGAQLAGGERAPEIKGDEGKRIGTASLYPPSPPTAIP